MSSATSPASPSPQAQPAPPTIASANGVTEESQKHNEKTLQKENKKLRVRKKPTHSYSCILRLSF